MKTIILITVFFIPIMYLCYQEFQGYLTLPVGQAKKEEDIRKGKLLIWIVLAVAGLIRIIAAAKYRGYEVDINCFLAWSNMIYEHGPGKFYYLENAFTDYPPGYMYVLYVLGFIRSVFGMDEGTLTVVLTKMPAIICDLVTGFLIFKIAGKHISKVGAAFVAAVFLITPAVILDSAVWGQVDSVFTLFVVLMCYLVTERKLIPSYFVFAIGILIKPQTLIFGPVLIFGIIDQVFIETLKYEGNQAFYKKFFKNLGFGLLAILMIFLLILPFGFNGDFANSPILKQYFDTISSYPYASVNAYNFWALLGKNWTPQGEGFLHFSYKIWGTFFIVQILVFAAIINFKSKIRETKYYFVGAFIVAGMFTMSVRMHERYIYPAMALLIICFALRPKLHNFLVYIFLSAVSFLNMAQVMFFYDPNNYDRTAVFPKIVSLFAVLVFDYLIYIALTQYVFKQQPEPAAENVSKNYKRKQRKDVGEKTSAAVIKKEIQSSEPLVRMEKNDWILLGIITVVYAVVAFVHLGNMSAPTTETSIVKEGQVKLDFGKNVDLSKIWSYPGPFHNPKYTVRYATEEMPDNWVAQYTEENPWDAGSVFCWNSKDLNIHARYIEIIPTAETTEDSLMELAFADADKNLYLPVNKENYNNLFDEQESLTKKEQYNGGGSSDTGTYFDEIYHARTAYEMIHHMRNYEWTHPPLGKFIISIGIRIFGMNPFGWRFMGTLFGVFMVPLFYIFAKKLFEETWLAGSVTVLFTFDFMHFAQTRISTIDVYVTFFIMLMYLFMFWYTKKSFYDTPLLQTFLPLGLCGTTMGIAWACKWTGIYASAGLCALFFITMGKRYMEYRYAKQKPNLSTDGISHQEIISGFPKKLALTLLFCVGTFVVIPVCIYTLSYIPFSDATDHGLIRQMLDNQPAMYNYHSQLEAEHSFSSLWYEWPVMKRPIWFFSGQTAEHTYQGISSFGNPLVWWAGIPAFLFVLYQWVMKKDRLCGFLSISYMSQYLPWILIGRTLFIYHYFPSVPFVVMMVGVCFKKLVEKKPKWKRCVYVYVAAAVGLFILFYPVLSAADVSDTFVNQYLRWFDDWQLISAPFSD